MTKRLQSSKPFTLVQPVGPNPLTDVYLGTIATKERSKQVFAARLIPSDRCNSAQEWIREEGRVLDSLQEPRLVPPIGVVQFDEQGAVLIPHEEGIDAVTVSRAGGWSVPRVTAVALEVSRALVALHGLGRSHGAMTSAAVRLTPQGEVRLVGLELAALERDCASPHTLGFDPSQCSPFLAPEQIFEIHRPASDTYALAAMMVTWITGSPMPRRSYRPEDHDGMVRDLRIRLRDCGTARSMRTLLSRMLAFFPNQRPDMTDVLRVLEKRQLGMGEVLSDWVPRMVRAQTVVEPQMKSADDKTMRLRARTVWMRRLQPKVVKKANIDKTPSPVEPVESQPAAELVKYSVASTPKPRPSSRRAVFDYGVGFTLALCGFLVVANILAAGVLATVLCIQYI